LGYYNGFPDPKLEVSFPGLACRENPKHKGFTEMIRTRSKIFKTFTAIALSLFIGGSAFGQVSLRKALDFDGDNKADFLIFRPGQNTWYVSKSNGGFIANQFGLAEKDYLAPGDYDGDGKGDLAVYRDLEGIWYVLNSSNSTLTAFRFGATGDEPVARDYDGDGKTDFAVVRRTQGAMIWYVWRSATNDLFAMQFGVSTDFTAPGDYDGDGKFDMAVQRPSSTSLQATFLVMNSSNSTLTATQWGFSTDYVVPGDYDGDGKTDLAVVREGATSDAQLTWFILKSDGSGIIVTGFGLTGFDYTAQGDYDGDGKTDIAIWRDETGTFYVLRSSDGNVSSLKWGMTGDFPIAAYDTH